MCILLIKKKVFVLTKCIFCGDKGAGLFVQGFIKTKATYTTLLSELKHV